MFKIKQIIIFKYVLRNQANYFLLFQLFSHPFFYVEKKQTQKKKDIHLHKDH